MDKKNRIKIGSSLLIALILMGSKGVYGADAKSKRNLNFGFVTEVESSITLKSTVQLHRTKILDFQGSVRYRREHDTYFFRAQKNDFLNVGDRVVTGPESWVILETQTSNGRTAASIGPNQLFIVDDNMQPSLQTSIKKQPNSDDVLTASANSKKIKGGGSTAPLSGFFDLNSIPEAPKSVSDSKGEVGQKIEGTRFLLEMKNLAVFFPLGSVFVATRLKKWEFKITLKDELTTSSYLVIDEQSPSFKRIQTKFLEAGVQEVVIEDLNPGEYQWQIFSADSSKRSRLGSIYVEQQKQGLFPLPTRALPGDSILFF